MILRREASATCRFFGGGVRVDQRAVDAVAQADDFLERLDVNIAGAILDRLNEDQVGQLDDRSFLDGSGELIEVDLFDGFLDGLEIFGVRLELRPVLRRPG